MTDDTWTLLDTQGETALIFHSFLDFDYQNEGQAADYPIEEGSFASYNKTASPAEIRVTLGMQGGASELDRALNRLDEYQRGALLLTVATPSALYKNMTLESCNYKRSQEENAGMLTVELTLKEIREVKTQVTTTVITKPKNPTSKGKANTGTTQTKEKPKSMLEKAGSILSGSKQ